MDKTFCIFGDSVPQAAYVKNGWVDLLREYLEEKYKKDFVNVFNLGIGGNTSVDILNRFQSESLARTPTSIIFAVGVNDSGYYKVTNKPVIGPAQFRSNLEKLAVAAKKFTQDITFVGLALGDDSILQPFLDDPADKSFTRQRAKSYDKIIQETAEKHHCQYIYLFDKLTPKNFLDGLHPNDHGHQKMFEVIKNYF